MEQLVIEWLKSHRLNITLDLSKVPDKPVTIRTEEFKGWYTFKKYGDDISLLLGNWAGDRWYYKTPSLDFKQDPTEYRELQEQAELELAAGYENAHLKALSLLNKSGQHMTTPYMERKGIDSPPTTYQVQNTYGYWDLLIPMHDLDGKIWSIQTIEPEGQKSFLEGGRTKGLMHCLTPRMSHDHIYIC